MGKLGNIFGVLALLLAGAAAFFSFTISQRRTEWRVRADKMAETVAKIVETVDEESGTAVASAVNFTPGDAAAKTKGDGSLSAIKFHEAKDDSGDFPDFQGVLDKALAHVNDLATRRTKLADTIYTAAQTLDLPEEEQPEVVTPVKVEEKVEEKGEDEGEGEGDVEGEGEGEEVEEKVEVQGVLAKLRNLGDSDAFADAAQKIQAHVAAVKDRDDAMLKALADAAKVIGEPINEKALTARRETQDDEGRMELAEYPCKTTLDAFQTSVVALDKRSSAYADTLASAMTKVKPHEGIFAWSADPDSVRSKRVTDYGPAHSEFLNDVLKLNEQLDNLVAARIDLVAKKKRIGELETDLEVANTKAKDAGKKIEEQMAIILRQEIELDKLNPDRLKTTDQTVLVEITGVVSEVDPEYNYVILNIGKLHGITEGKEMLVARGDEYIARVKIAEVHAKNSVANIMPLAMNGTVKPQDIVIMVNPPKPEPQP